MTVGELLIGLRIGLDKDSLSKAHKALKDLTNLSKRFTASLASGFMGAVRHSSEMATHLVSLAAATGLSIEAFQEWSAVAQLSGSNAKELSVGLGMFERNLREFARGGGGKIFARAMAQIGMSAQDAKKALASPEGLDQALMKIADRFKAMGNTPERGALGQRLFGARAGRAMIADLARGSQGIDEIRKKFRETGAEISEKDALGLRTLSNRLTILKLEIEGALAHIVAKIAPYIERFVDFVERAMRAIRGLINDAFGGDTKAQAILIGIAAVITTLIIPALYAMVAPITAAMFAMAPMQLLLTAIGVAALLIVKHWDDIKRAAVGAVDWAWDRWRAFGDWFTGLGDRMIDGISEFADWIETKVGEAIDWVIDKFHKLEAFIESLPGVQWGIKHFGSERGPREANARAEMAKPEAVGVIGKIQAYERGYDAPLIPASTVAPKDGVSPANANAPAAPTNATTNVTNNFKIDGAKDPKAVGDEVYDRLDGMWRSAQRGLGGAIR